MTARPAAKNRARQTSRSLRRPLLFLAAALALLILWFGFEVGRVYFGEPTITMDANAELNAIALGGLADPADLAVHREAWTVFDDLTERAQSLLREREEAWEQALFDNPGESESPIINAYHDWAQFGQADFDPDAAQKEIESLRRLAEAGIFADLDAYAAGPVGLRSFDAEQGVFATLMPELSRARGLAKACVAGMRMAALDGDAEALDQWLARVIALDRTMAAQPILINLLVAGAIQQVWLNELHQILMEIELTETEARRLLARVRTATSINPALAVEGERIGFLDVIQRTHTDSGGGRGFCQPWRLQTLGVNAGGPAGGRNIISAAYGRFVMASRQETVRYYESYINAVRQYMKTPPAQRAFSSPDAGLARLPRRQMMLRLLAPAMTRAIDSGLDMQSRLGALELACAAAVHRARTGVWPASADELVPDLLDAAPTDEYGMPLIFRPVTADPAGRPYLVYSAGENLADDGGQPDDGESPSGGPAPNGVDDEGFNRARPPGPASGG